MSSINYRYYVEGDDERTILNTLKTELGCIRPGRVEKFNVIQNRLTVSHVRLFRPNTVVVFVYDTDVNKTDILKKNIEFLKKQSSVKDVICIPQVPKLEKELVRACNIKNAKELTGSSSDKDFKRDLIGCTNLGKRLQKYEFDIEKFWNSVPQNEFQIFSNDASKIKIKSKK